MKCGTGLPCPSNRASRDGAKIFANVAILPCVLRPGATRIPLGDVANVTVRGTMKNGPRVKLPVARVANAETGI